MNSRSGDKILGRNPTILIVDCLENSESMTPAQQEKVEWWYSSMYDSVNKLEVESIGKKLMADNTRLFGKRDNWIRLTYFDRYGLTTSRAQDWLRRPVVIKSTQGYWRPEAQGYSERIGGAGIYTMSEAYRFTKGLGPEKGVIFVDVSRGIFA